MSLTFVNLTELQVTFKESKPHPISYNKPTEIKITEE